MSSSAALLMVVGWCWWWWQCWVVWNNKRNLFQMNIRKECWLGKTLRKHHKLFYGGGFRYGLIIFFLCALCLVFLCRFVIVFWLYIFIFSLEIEICWIFDLLAFSRNLFSRDGFDFLIQFCKLMQHFTFFCIFIFIILGIVWTINIILFFIEHVFFYLSTTPYKTLKNLALQQWNRVNLIPHRTIIGILSNLLNKIKSDLTS